MSPERPLAARSLIASLLLRSDPPRMRGARLVQWCGLFGVAEGTARVALSRMVERGELRARNGNYELAGRVRGRAVAQDWSLDPALPAWMGAWRFAVVTTTGRDAGERGALRDAMRHLRFGELREGAWARPDNLPRSSAPDAWWEVAEAQCSWWSGRPDDDPVVLAGGLFAVDEWTKRAGALARRLSSETRALEDGGDASLARAFLAGTVAVAHLRADPLLPSELADVDAGESLRHAYRAYEVAFTRAARTWFREQ